jgi:hypothetical protein
VAHIFGADYFNRHTCQNGCQTRRGRRKGKAIIFSLESGGQVMWQQLLPFAGKLIDKLIPDPEAKAKAQLELAQMAQQGELQKMANETELYKAEQDNVSDRWKADAATGSWLAQNIRPLTLAYILSAYLGLALLDGYGIKVAEAYVTLLGQWGMLVMSAYFGGRTLEKIMGMKKND